jgi:hypothetical protein
VSKSNLEVIVRRANMAIDAFRLFMYTLDYVTAVNDGKREYVFVGITSSDVDDLAEQYARSIFKLVVDSLRNAGFSVERDGDDYVVKDGDAEYRLRLSTMLLPGIALLEENASKV